MRELLRNWKILLLICLLVFAFLTITFNGIQLGVDFKGGTLFQIHLAEKAATPDQLSSIRAIIEHRMDAFGLKDTRVDTAGDEYIIARIAETDPARIEALESLLKTQGKFEAIFDGNILFTGSDIIQIIKDPRRGYGFRWEDDLIRWNLPFSLKAAAAENFSRMVFHRCTIISYDPAAGNQYDCELTYFFIDRSVESIIVIPFEVYNADKELLLQGNRERDIPADIEIAELLLNADSPYIVVDENMSSEQRALLNEWVKEKKYAIVPPILNQEIKDELIGIGFRLREEKSISDEYFIEPTEDISQRIVIGETVPWVWQVSGAQQVISLSPSVTNLEPYVANVGDAKIFSDLFITGVSSVPQDAQEKLSNLSILLETGSLPIPIESISKETISAFLGKEFLQTTFFIGIIALIIVSLVIFVRYRNLKLSLPILFTGLSEVCLILGFASLIGWSLDLAAVAGILAAVGTGVDHQIIITDELIRGEETTVGSLVNRIKRAFFIIMAAACTTIATMFPLLLFGFGMGKLVGFALTTIAGVLIGVLITRPAYSEIAKYLLSKY